MDYFLRKFPNLPYTVAVIYYCIPWALLCGALGYFLILSQADFVATGTKAIFVFTFPLYVLIVAIMLLGEYGGLKIIGLKEKRRELRVLNENIKGGHIVSGVSVKTLKEIFYSLTDRPMDAIRVGFKQSGLVMLFVIITEYIASNGMTTNLFTIFISGVVIEILLVVFLIFFAQHFISPSLQECRTMLVKRGVMVKEPQFIFNNLETKLIISFTIPIFSVLIISFVFQLSLKIIIFVLISLIIAALMSKVLSFSISQAFAEIKDFTKELSKDKRVFFSTGSLNPEVVDLSIDLNKAAEEIYAFRRKTKQSREELKKRVAELEKWKVLVVGRELKMAELKKEKKELELKPKKRKRQ